MSPVTRGRNDLWGGLLLAIGLVLGLFALAGVSIFKLALTGFFVWLAIARKQGWAWIPAAIFGFRVLSELLDGAGGSLLFPLLVIAGGVLLLARDRLCAGATTWILIGLLATGIFAARDDNQEAPPRLRDRPSAPAEQPAEPVQPEPQPLPALDGRELVIRFNSGDIVLRPARDPQGSIQTVASFEIIEEDDQVIVAGAGEKVEIRLPAEADVLVITRDGDVTAETGGFDLEVESESGDIRLELSTAAQVLAEARHGSITASPSLPDRDPSPQLFLHGESGPRVSVETRRGDISIAEAA